MKKEKEYVDYMAKKAQALQNSNADEFEEVKSKRRVISDSEESPEDYRTPQSLGISIKTKEKQVKTAILEALDTFQASDVDRMRPGSLQQLFQGSDFQDSTPVPMSSPPSE